MPSDMDSGGGRKAANALVLLCGSGLSIGRGHRQMSMATIEEMFRLVLHSSICKVIESAAGGLMWVTHQTVQPKLAGGLERYLEPCICSELKANESNIE